MAKNLSAQRQALGSARDSLKRADLALRAYENLKAIPSLGADALQNSRAEIAAAAQQLAERVAMFQAGLSELFETDDQEGVQANGQDFAA